MNEEPTGNQEQPQMTPEQQKQMQYLHELRVDYLSNYETLATHTAKYFTNKWNEAGDKVFKDKAVYTGMFPQLRLKKIWKSDNKYNADGTLKDAKAEAKRQEYLAEVA